MREDEKATATATSGPPVPSSWLPPQLAAKAPKQPFSRHADNKSASVGRRGRAVEAYCRELFVPSIPTGVAHEILDSLTGAIRDDAELLQTVRTAAAERVRTGDRTEHSATPSSLAARANGTIQPQDLAMLESHLATCLACRAAEVRAVRADRAFAGVIGLTLKTSA